MADIKKLRLGDGTVAVTEKEHLDYMSNVPVETSMRSTLHHVISPIGGVANQNGPFTFVIDSQPEWNYIDLNRARLEMKARVVKGDNEKLSLLDNVVAPVNLLGATMWDKVDVEMNNHTFTPSSSVMAGKKHYIHTILTDNTSSKENQLHTQLFHPDTPGYWGVCIISRATAKKLFIYGCKDEKRANPSLTFAKEDLAAKDGIRMALDNWENMELLDCPEELEMAAGVESHSSKEQAKLVKRWKKVEQAFNKYLHDNDLDHKVKRYHYNEGFDKRFQLVMNSREFDTLSPVPHDAFEMDNHIGPKNRLVIRLTRASDKIILDTFEGEHHYKLQIIDLKLHFDTIELKANIPMPLNERYLMNETQLHTHLVAVNSPSTHIRLQDSGVLPKMVIVCMTSTRAADGDYAWNPWNFYHYYLESIFLTVNGVRMPQDTLKMNFEIDPKQCAQAYGWLFDNTGATIENKGNLVTPKRFTDGYFFVPFDLTPDKCAMEHMHDAIDGSLTLDMKFSRPLDSAIYVHYELVYPKRITNLKPHNILAIEDVDV